ncbi:hypothetical protein [Neorhodopirellula lusitana]|nr:hypothetical protein [Neorhodopirellula lusitana]
MSHSLEKVMAIDTELIPIERLPAILPMVIGLSHEDERTGRLMEQWHA